MEQPTAVFGKAWQNSLVLSKLTSPREFDWKELLNRYHEDHIAAEEINSLRHHDLVHKFLPMPQALNTPNAKAAVEREWDLQLWTCLQLFRQVPHRRKIWLHPQMRRNSWLRQPASRTRRNLKSDAASSSQVRLQDTYLGGLPDKVAGKPVATDEHQVLWEFSESESWSNHESEVSEKPVVHTKGTGSFVASNISENSGILKLKAGNCHIISISPAVLSYMDKVYSIVRKTYDRGPMDEMEAFLRMFMNTTLQAAVHLSLNNDQNFRFVKNYFWSSLKKLFKETEKLIKNQKEITGVSMIDHEEHTWSSTTLLCDRIHQISNAKTYVFAYSVLRLGGIKENQVRKEKIKWYFEKRLRREHLFAFVRFISPRPQADLGTAVQLDDKKLEFAHPHLDLETGLESGHRLAASLRWTIPTERREVSLARHICARTGHPHIARADVSLTTRTRVAQGPTRLKIAHCGVSNKIPSCLTCCRMCHRTLLHDLSHLPSDLLLPHCPVLRNWIKKPCEIHGGVAEKLNLHFPHETSAVILSSCTHACWRSQFFEPEALLLHSDGTSGCLLAEGLEEPAQAANVRWKRHRVSRLSLQLPNPHELRQCGLLRVDGQVRGRTESDFPGGCESQGEPHLRRW